ncbi:lysophospholipid acyltransferase family protein [Acidicapsa dinghuensis]|uniref:Lysophospholipid acyltransferase family protein n=1 Tax=Acidicapsa dinghuensis TaxID=2218256 RepID=A0ABW1EK47_9BACT|nr:lysophospholipid acyltransferase family protein [Acidicapsa dinghuensis]
MTTKHTGTSSSARFTFAQSIILAVVPRIVWALLMIVGRTWRFEVMAEEGVTPAFHGFTPGREIYCFWHQCVLPCAYYFRNTGATILISQSFDGELITRILELFGYHAVRGSSTRGGQQGLIGLNRVLDEGTPAIFTADGPRGPIYRAKMGPVKLAQLSGAPIGSFHLQPQKAWIMRSWDQFFVPKPFTRIAVSWGQWTIVSEEATNDELPTLRDQLDVTLERVRMRAIAHLAGKDLA